MARNIDYLKILEDESSFQLVRTNPKLTGNIKFTVDGNDNMWFNSIDANEELSKASYKRVAIDPSISMAGNMYRFFNGGTTASELVFSLSESFDSTKTSNDYKDQYDFSHYFSGAKYLTSRRYDEKLSYFAPLYLKKNIPDYFVIFKIENPLNKKISTLKSEYPENKETYLKDLFKTASIVKTFDIRETTKVGKYIRDYYNDSNFPSSPLSAKYEEDAFTTFNGILYDSGVLGERGELLESLYSASNPLKFFEETLTLGYERNGVIFPNIINFEFIFDDSASNLYDFNRYFGVYVNALELDKLNIDLKRAYDERGSWENTPRFRRQFYEYEDININQNNPSGNILPVKMDSLLLSDFENIFSDQNEMFFNYIQDRDNNLHIPKLDSPYTIELDPNGQELLTSKIRMSNKDINLGKFFGPGKEFLQDTGVVSKNRGFSHSFIKVDSVSTLDSFKIYHPNGTQSDSVGKYDLLTGTDGYSQCPNPGDFYFYHDIDNIVGSDTFYFDVNGTPADIVNAISGCLNNIRNKNFKAFAVNEYIFVKSNIAGNLDDTFKLEFDSPTLAWNGITINRITGTSLQNNQIDFEGGSLDDDNRLLIDSGHYEKITSNQEDILVKTVEGWSKIKKVSSNIDVISELNIAEAEANAPNNLDSKKAIIESFFKDTVVTLELGDSPDIKYGEFVMFKRHRPSFGLLSFFPISDFDFDFYSSEYLNFPLIDLYYYYFIPPNTSLFSNEYEYEVYGDGSILVSDGSSYSQGDTFTTLSGASYEVTSGTPVVSYSAQNPDVSTHVPYDPATGAGNRYDIPSNDQNGGIPDFPGFFLLKDPDRVVEESNSDEYLKKTKYINGIAQTEYDYYKENFSRDFALKSKILPYITKWVKTNGLDSRSNPYRLNSELVFGFNNFSPDHDDISQNPSKFTHEWFYIESKFNYLNDINTVKLNNSYFDSKFDKTVCLTDSDYFINYFTYTPSFSGEEVGKTQIRYSQINKNELGEYETFFKGFKIKFKDFIDSSNLSADGKPESNLNSTRFDGYKFSAILTTTKEDILDPSTPPIKYEMIEHKTFKYIVLVIELNLGVIENVDSFWLKNINTSILSPTPSITNGDFVGNNNFLDTNAPLLDYSLPYESINGDYRISIDLNGVSNMNHTLLYSLKNKKYNTFSNNFSNIKLTKMLDLSATGAFQGATPTIINAIDNVNIPNYPSKLSEEINRTNIGTFLSYNAIGTGIDFFLDDTDGAIINFNESYLKSAGINFVDYYEQQAPTTKIINENNIVASNIPTLLPAAYYRDNTIFKVITGGELYYQSMLSKLSFGKFKSYVNSMDKFIEYKTFTFDGTNSVLESSDSFYCEVPDVTTISKVDAVVSQVDNDIPANISSENVVGFAYQRAAMDNSYEINRYDGGFSPLVKSLFSFNSTFTFTNNNISSLSLSNTKFNIGIDNFLKISNFNHIKVSDSKILSLESDDRYDPRYEIVDEIAIGREDYFLLKSNWDYGFHYKYTSKKNRVPVSGTLRIEEDYSFISKLLTLRSELELENPTLTVHPSIDSINQEEIELAVVEKDDRIEGIINLENILTSYLISDGIMAQFNSFLENSPEYIGNFESIEEYVKEYIKQNILKLYQLIDVEFYEKKDKSLINQGNISNQNAISFNFLDDTQRFDLGYKLNKNLRINKIDRLILKFEFNKKLSSGILISPKIKMNFI